MNKSFTTGFALGLILFVAANLTAAHLASDCGLAAVFGRDSCADDILRAGWPLRFYEEGGFGYRLVLDLPVLILDLVIGVLFAAGLGWIFTRRMKQNSGAPRGP